MSNVEFYEQRIADLETQQLDRFFKCPPETRPTVVEFLNEALEEAVTTELMRCYRKLQLARLAQIRFGK